MISLASNPVIRRARHICPLILASTLLFASGAKAAGPSESEVLSALTTKGIDTSFDNLTASAAALNEAAVKLCDERSDESLLAAQNLWKEAYGDWRKTAPFLVGPAANLDREVGKPVNAIVLKAVVESEEFADLANGSDVRGYSAVEYILFTPQNASEASNALHCKHLLKSTQEIVQHTTAAKEGWEKDFREGFLNAGDGLPYLIPGDAISLVYAEILNVTETMLRDHIAIPSNFFKGKARPELLEAPYSRTSTEGFMAVLAGLRTALSEPKEANLINLIATKDGVTHEKDPKLAKAIDKQLAKTEKTLGRLLEKEEDLYTALENSPKSLKKLYSQLQKLQELLAKGLLVLELDVRQGLEAQLAREQ